MLKTQVFICSSLLKISISAAEEVSAISANEVGWTANKRMVVAIKDTQYATNGRGANNNYKKSSTFCLGARIMRDTHSKTRACAIGTKKLDFLRGGAQLRKSTHGAVINYNKACSIIHRWHAQIVFKSRAPQNAGVSFDRALIHYLSLCGGGGGREFCALLL